jgi:hypothetical protein
MNIWKRYAGHLRRLHDIRKKTTYTQLWQRLSHGGHKAA